MISVYIKIIVHSKYSYELYIQHLFKMRWESLDTSHGPVSTDSMCLPDDHRVLTCHLALLDHLLVFALVIVLYRDRVHATMAGGVPLGWLLTWEPKWMMSFEAKWKSRDKTSHRGHPIDFRCLSYADRIFIDVFFDYHYALVDFDNALQSHYPLMTLLSGAVLLIIFLLLENHLGILPWERSQVRRSLLHPPFEARDFKSVLNYRDEAWENSWRLRIRLFLWKWGQRFLCLTSNVKILGDNGKERCLENKMLYYQFQFNSI